MNHINEDDHLDDNSAYIQQNYSFLMSRLINIWRNEKLSQDLLTYEEALINDVIQSIEKKEEEIKNEKFDKNIRNFIELDIQRLKYIIKDYLRIRLMKIEKYLFFLMKNNKQDLLSQNEIKFAAELMDVKASYFIQSLKKMNSLANNFFQFTDKNKTRVEKVRNIPDPMITKPPENDFVIVQNISNETIILNIKEIYSDYQNEFVTLYSGDKCLLPFKIIKNELDKKKLKII